MMFPKPKRKKKRQQSKRREENQVYLGQRDEYLKAHPVCQVCDADLATQVHHSAGRIKNLLTNPNYFFAVCRSCHEHIHANPKWAYENGYLLERNKLTEFE